MMFPGLITIPTSQWIWIGAIIVAPALGLLLWSYKRASRITSAHRLALALKIIGIIILILCLVEPVWSGKRAKTGANIFAVVADNSSGMNVRDKGADQTRGQILHAALDNGQANWIKRMADDFQVRQYIFDSRLSRTTDFSELVFEGTTSAIGTILRTITDRYSNRPLAGVLLMTDGIATDIADELYDFTGMPPVYPVIIGGDKPQRDLALTNISVTQTAFEDAPVLIQADVQATGYAGRALTIEISDNAGELIESQTWRILKEDDKTVFRFRLKPDKTGIIFYHVKIAELLENLLDVNPQPLTEATLINNEQTVIVDRGQGPYRILYVSGRPNWEYKFLQRAISEDLQLQIVALIRVAKREPKYVWLGHEGETSNPMYRGYGEQDQERIEQYDEPVFVRINTRDEAELIDGFPKTQDQLFGYNAIILDDVEAEFFTIDQMDLIRRFVSERGGGFLMLGGQESFYQGQFDNTPIESVLPVYVDSLPYEVPVNDIHLFLTRQGWLEPWARLRDNESAERTRISTMPQFRVLNRVRGTKAGATIIATMNDQADNRFPALVVQRFGKGRSAALTVGDIWRWGIEETALHADMEKFWRQTIRWLVADVPDRVMVQATQRPDLPNQPVTLRVNARDESFEPLDNVTVTIEVNEPGGKLTHLTAEPALNESGRFEATYVPRLNGGYLVKAIVASPDNIELGNAQTGWAADLQSQEFRSITTNKALLEKIARQTKGKIIELDKLDDFVKDLPNTEVPITAVVVKPLWDLPGVLPAIFLFVLVCFITEWTLRRWKGLP